MKNYYRGLGMEDGREVNDRPDSRMGITKLAEAKKMYDKAYKEQCIANGIKLARIQEK